jgi:casein kinase II subunit alpha
MIKNVDYSLKDIKNIMRCILVGVSEAHKRGIFHRDLKPGNIIVEKKSSQARIIDWGLAEFYAKNKDFNIRVATRPFKPPEFLVEHKQYNHAVDVWGAGCVFGCLAN